MGSYLMFLRPYVPLSCLQCKCMPLITICALKASLGVHAPYKRAKEGLCRLQQGISAHAPAHATAHPE